MLAKIAKTMWYMVIPAVVNITMLFAFALAPTAPVPRVENSERLDYYPTSIGTEWCFSSDTDGEWTERLVKREVKNGTAYLTIAKLNSRGIERLRLVVSESTTQISRVARDDTQDDPQWCWLKIPPQADTCWEYQSDEKGDPEIYRIGEAEDVEVPAGKYRAFPVYISVSDKSLPIAGIRKCTRWYVRGIGMVKQKGAPNIELKSFTRGTADKK